MVLHLAEVLIAIIRLTIHLGMQSHLGLMLLHALEPEVAENEAEEQDPSHVGVLRASCLILTKLTWNWVPKIHHLLNNIIQRDQGSLCGGSDLIRYVVCVFQNGICWKGYESLPSLQIAGWKSTTCAGKHRLWVLKELMPVVKRYILYPF